MVRHGSRQNEKYARYWKAANDDRERLDGYCLQEEKKKNSKKNRKNNDVHSPPIIQRTNQHDALGEEEIAGPRDGADFAGQQQKDGANAGSNKDKTRKNNQEEGANARPNKDKKHKKNQEDGPESTYGVVYPVPLNKKQYQQAVAGLKEAQLLFFQAILPSYYYEPDDDREIQFTHPIWSIDYINAPCPSILALRFHTGAFPTVAWEDMMSQNPTNLNHFVGTDVYCGQLCKCKHVKWKLADHEQFVQCMNRAKGYAYIEYELPSVQDAQSPRLLQEQNRMLNSFWKMELQLYPETFPSGF